jgi:poly-gamma-glutamate capsule biosynthesis protein CapA/YwtB (metallophosphatase superfamily)
MLRLAGTAIALLLVAGCTTTKTGDAQGPPASTPPTKPTGVPTLAPANAITIAAVGDILMGSAPDKLPPKDGAGFFERVAPALRVADLTMGNLETPLSDPTDFVKCPKPPPPPSVPPESVPPSSPPPSTPPPKETCFAFRLPPSYATVLKDGGFHVVSLANNHTNDAGPAGLRNTRSALSAAGVRATGGQGEIATHSAKGITAAVLGFGPYSWMQSVLDHEAAAKLVRKAQEQADVVVVNMHVGGEGADRQHVKPGTEMFLGENRGDPMGFARAVIDAGADLVVGHSPHVLRGMEFYKGRLIAYSMGNFAGYKVLSSAGPAGIGGVLHASLAKDGSWVGGRFFPTIMADGGIPTTDLKARSFSMLIELSTADFPTTAAKLATDGAITAR